MLLANGAVDNDLLTAFVDRAIGSRAETAGDNWFFAGGVFGEEVSPSSDEDEGWGVASRFVVAPILGDEHVVHLGLRGAFRKPASSDGGSRFCECVALLSPGRVTDGTVA